MRVEGRLHLAPVQPLLVAEVLVGLAHQSRRLNYPVFGWLAYECLEDLIRTIIREKYLD